jgi:uncharacterized protein (DUF1778 family)
MQVERRRGRPRRAEDRADTFCIRLTPEERQRVDLAASANHQTPSDFARDAIVTAAADCLEAIS